MSASQPKPDFRADLRRRLHDPFQLRVIVTALALALGYAGIFLPLSGALEEATRRRAEGQRRLDLARDVARLRREYHRMEGRLPAGTDANEWVEYVLGGIRRHPLKLVTLESEKPRAVGPYQAVVLRISLEGSFAELNRFLRWLDGNERLLRVDALKLDPDPKQGSLTMHLTVLGMMG
jgi:Tfp pilus assembly protein PilO